MLPPRSEMADILAHAATPSGAGPMPPPPATSAHDRDLPQAEALGPEGQASEMAAHDPAAEPADATGHHDDLQTLGGAIVQPDPAAASSVANTIADAPPIAPAIADDGPAIAAETKSASSPSEDIESFAARRARLHASRHRSPWHQLNLPTVIMALLVLVAVLVGWRHDVVRLMPQTASFFSMFGLNVNLRGLAFTDVKILREQQDGVNVLMVDGNIVSQVPKPVEVPRLRFSVRDESGREIYAWTALPARTVLTPGAVLPFRSRLASPPPETRTVLLRFFNRRDIVAGTR